MNTVAIRTFIWNAFDVGICSYFVFFKGASPWWYVICLAALKGYQEVAGSEEEMEKE